MSTKVDLRRKYVQIRDGLDKDSRNCMSENILGILCDTDVYKKAKTVFVYVSVGSEVKTHSLIDKALSDGKRVVVPLCNTLTHSMDIYEIKDRGQLETGSYSIPEPKANLILSGAIQKVMSSEIDLAIVPAVVFDKRGMRIGYGGGYYDRFLCEFKGVAAGIAFEQCIVDELPTEEFDCGVDMVICSEGMIDNGEFIYKG